MSWSRACCGNWSNRRADLSQESLDTLERIGHGGAPSKEGDPRRFPSVHRAREAPDPVTPSENDPELCPEAYRGPIGGAQMKPIPDASGIASRFGYGVSRTGFLGGRGPAQAGDLTP